MKYFYFSEARMSNGKWAGAGFTSKRDARAFFSLHGGRCYRISWGHYLDCRRMVDAPTMRIIGTPVQFSKHPICN